MFVVIHLIIALGSLAHATYTLVAPSRSRLYVSYALIAGTIISGTLLVIASPGHMLQACVSGITYTTVASFTTVLTHRKLEAKAIRIHKK